MVSVSIFSLICWHTSGLCGHHHSQTSSEEAGFQFYNWKTDAPTGGFESQTFAMIDWCTNHLATYTNSLYKFFIMSHHKAIAFTE